MPEDKVVKRRKLKVLEVKEPRKIGKGTKWGFKATDIEAGKDYDYECWSKAFADELKDEIDTDIEYSETESQGTTYKHRKIIEIYKDGKPIPKPSRGGGYSQRDEGRTDARTAIMEIGASWRGGKLSDNSPLVLDWKVWCTTVLGITGKQRADFQKAFKEETT